MQMNLPIGQQLAIQGAQMAADNAGPVWAEHAYTILVAYAKHNHEFMTEDVRSFAHREYELPLPPDGRAWGAIVSRAVKAGLIKRIGYAPMKSANCHANPKSVWRYVGDHR